jgi:multidrug resistance protein MdtO
VTISDFIGFLRRELAPTPGRGSATLRLTLACLIASIPILTHRIPHGLVVMIVMYLITQEDTAATLLGSILAVIGVTLGLGLALLAWMVCLDIAWLRLCIAAAFLFGGLFLKRVLVIGALGSAIGLPAGLVMILPDVMTVPYVFSPSVEMLTEFVLWIWLCVALGLAVNLGVQLLLAPGDPLTLLQSEVDTRLRVVGEIARALGGAARPGASLTASLTSLATAGMSRPLALLKTASLTRAWARQRHEELSAIITLVDRLVTDAGALVNLSSSSGSRDVVRGRLIRIADACEGTRRAFAERHRPATSPGFASVSLAEGAASALPLLDDMERVLDQLALAARVRTAGDAGQDAGPRLLLPDAFTNPEYMQFAVKGSLAAFTCYVLFIGFDYPGIYTSVITCFVVSLSTIGSSNQKGLLRFGGAAVGGLMGLLVLVYAFPNIEGIGGFWLVFGAGTAVAAWVNFGTPRISYGGYQTGLAFYKAVLQGFAPAVSATVVRDRLIGVFLGLVVFGIVEQVLWPIRATDRMRERLADVLSSLADLALQRAVTVDVNAQRRLVSQQVADVQGFIESSKFEPGAADSERIAKLVGEAQIVFLILLALLHHEREIEPLPSPLREVTGRLVTDVAMSLRALAEHMRGAGPAPTGIPGDAFGAVERLGDVDSEGTETDPMRGVAALYRELVTAVKRLMSVEMHGLVVHEETSV